MIPPTSHANFRLALPKFSLSSTTSQTQYPKVARVPYSQIGLRREIEYLASQNQNAKLNVDDFAASTGTLQHFQNTNPKNSLAIHTTLFPMSQPPQSPQSA